MPQLTAMTQAIRKDQALQVWVLLETDKKITLDKACQQIGITPPMYRRWIIESEEALDQFRIAQTEVQKIGLAQVLQAREQILARLIKDALAPFTDPGIRLSIYQYLVGHTDELIERTREINSDDMDFLMGPKQMPATSRFSASEVEITIKTKQAPIIDITPTEQE